MTAPLFRLILATVITDDWKTSYIYSLVNQTLNSGHSDQIQVPVVSKDGCL